MATVSGLVPRALLLRPRRGLVVKLFALLAAGSRACAGDDSENLVLAHNQQLFTVDLDFGTGVLAKQNAVAGFNIKRLARSVFFVLTCSGSNNFAFLRFLLGAVGDDDASTNLFAFFNAFHDHAVV